MTGFFTAKILSENENVGNRRGERVSIFFTPSICVSYMCASHIIMHNLPEVRPTMCAIIWVSKLYDVIFQGRPRGVSALRMFTKQFKYFGVPVESGST